MALGTDCQTHNGCPTRFKPRPLTPAVQSQRRLGARGPDGEATLKPRKQSQVIGRGGGGKSEVGFKLESFASISFSLSRLRAGVVGKGLLQECLATYVS